MPVYNCSVANMQGLLAALPQAQMTSKIPWRSEEKWQLTSNRWLTTYHLLGRLVVPSLNF
jgi:hypothetical protein